MGFFEAFCKVYLTLYSPRSGPCTFWAFSRHFLKSISLYIVLGAGRAHFGIFGPVSILLYVFAGIFQKMRYGKKTRRVNIPLRVTARDLKKKNTQIRFHTVQQCTPRVLSTCDCENSMFNGLEILDV